MRLLIVDDDKLVCASLKIILETEPSVHVVGIGHNGFEAVMLYQELQPDILLMDIRMKESTGLEAAEKILAQYPEAKIMFLTTFSDDEYIIKALHMGVKGYLLKQDYDSILPALRSVDSGQSVFGDDVMTKIPQLLGSSSGNFMAKNYGLSDKEGELIALIAEGLSNKEIAETLFLGEGTVRNYLSTLLDKLQLRDRTQLAVFYYKNKGGSQ